MSPQSSDAIALNALLDQFDSSTTKAGTAVTAIQTRIQKLLDAASTDTATGDMQTLIARVNTELANFSPIVDSLTAMGQDPANPVPVPVPDPGTPVAQAKR